MAKKKSSISPLGIVIIVVLVVLQILGIYWLFNKAKSSRSDRDGSAKQPNDGGGVTVIDTGGGKGPAPTPSTFIQQGSRGSTVKFLQEYLNWKISAGLATDGIWGAKTQVAVGKAGLPSRLSNLDIDRLTKEYNDNQKPWWDIFGSYSSSKLGQLKGVYAIR